MAKFAKFDHSEFTKFLKKLEGAPKAADEFMREFLLEMALRALNKIKKRTPVNSGDLRRTWMVGEIVKHGNSYLVEIFNLKEYASYAEYGFRSHFVPGYWSGNNFVYDPNSKDGMYVGEKGGWVEGRFMATISMKEIEREFPKYLEKRQAEFLKRTFK